MKPFMKQGLKLLPLIIIPIIYISYNHFFKPEELLERLEAEFAQIEPPENTFQTNFKKYFKPTNALFRADYLTEKGKIAIINHYDAVLKRNDWKFCCRIDGKSRDKLLFQKGQFTAYLHYPEYTEGKFQYSFSMSWGLGGCEFDCNTDKPNHAVERTEIN
jgi:hypothetical protein